MGDERSERVVMRVHRFSPAERKERLVELGGEKVAESVLSPFNGDQMYWRGVYGIHLRTLRKSMGLTQEEFGKLCDLSGNAVSELEVCKRSPNLDTLSKIADRTGVNPVWFLDESPESLNAINNHLLHAQEEEV